MLLSDSGGLIHLDQLEPGDILLTLFDPFMIWSYPIWFATRSKYIHSTLYVGDGKEWSIDWNGSSLRPVGTDRWQRVFRPNDYAVARAAAEFAKSDKGRVTGYNLEGAVWQGIQSLGGVQQRTPLPWKTKAKFCSEGTTDIFVYLKGDIVPDLETGVVLPGDIDRPQTLAYSL